MKPEHYRATIRYIRSCSDKVLVRLQAHLGRKGQPELLALLTAIREGKAPSDFPVNSRDWLHSQVVVRHIHDYRGLGRRPKLTVNVPSSMGGRQREHPEKEPLKKTRYDYVNFADKRR